jgi:hypothetical protein
MGTGPPLGHFITFIVYHADSRKSFRIAEWYSQDRLCNNQNNKCKEKTRNDC